MKDNKDYTIKYLVNALRESGISRGTNVGIRQTISLWMRNGKLKLRQRPNGYNVVNEEETAEIIKEFSPGGIGRWSYERR